MKKLRTLSLTFIAFLPWAIKKRVLSLAFGYQFEAGARIGLALVDVKRLEMGPNSYIGSFTVIRNLSRLKIGEHSKIGTFNWIFGMLESGAFFTKEHERESALILGNHSAVTSRHLLDCIDLIEVGSFTTLAGFRSQYLTHAIDLRLNRQSCAPIRIGSHCFIGTGVLILKGVVVPDRCAIAAGSVVAKSLEAPDFVYAGNPVQKLRALDGTEKYYHRETGNVK